MIENSIKIYSVGQNKGRDVLNSELITVWLQTGLESRELQTLHLPATVMSILSGLELWKGVTEGHSTS